MANIFKSLKKKASLNRNGFDLSQRHIFSGKAGQMLPVLSIDCIPGDYHEINLLSLVRTMPLKTDAFARMRVRFCFGFVPYWQNWHPWNEFILQTVEPQSVEESGNLPVFAPYFSLYQVLEAISYDVIDVSNLDRTHAEPGAYENYRDVFGYYRYENAVRMLDLLGYGSFYNVVGRAYAVGQIADEAQQALAQQELLNWIESNYIIHCNAFRILAYHKFYFDYFRNQNYEVIDPFFFNVDNCSGTSRDSAIIGYEDVYEFLCNMRYAPYAKDKFTSLFSTPQFGSVSTVSLANLDIKNDGASLSAAAIAKVNTSTSINGPRSLYIDGLASTTSGKWSISDAFSVYDLRKAEMFQRWKEDKLRAGNKTKDQAVAMWGKPFKYAQDNYSEFVDEIDVNLNIDEVLNQAASENYELGQIGGKSIGAGNGKIKFQTDDFGTLMCIAIVEPIGEYNSFMVDKNNTLIEPFDFATPHFENLGFEAVSQAELSLPVKIDSNSNYPSHVIGYGPRFMNYKTAVDKCHGEFQGYGHGAYGDYTGSLSPWSIPRTALQLSSIRQSSGIKWLHFKIDPAVLNTIFYAQAGDGQDTDQFLFNCNFDIKSVRNLSVLGLPQW